MTFHFRMRQAECHSGLQARDDLNSDFSRSDVSLACVRVQNEGCKNLKLFVIRTNDCGSTPITVAGRRFKIIFFPIMLGSA